MKNMVNKQNKWSVGYIGFSIICALFATLVWYVLSKGKDMDPNTFRYLTSATAQVFAALVVLTFMVTSMLTERYKIIIETNTQLLHSNRIELDRITKKCSHTRNRLHLMLKKGKPLCMVEVCQ